MAENYAVYRDAEGDYVERENQAQDLAEHRPEPKRKNGNGHHAEYGKGKTEVYIPNDPPLRLWMEAAVYEGDRPTNCIIDADNEWSVRVHWHLDGALKNFICGYWCLHLHLESMGHGPEFSIPAPEENIPLNACDDKYWYEIKVPGGKIEPAHCSSPYKLVVSLTYKDPCYKKGPMAGFVELPLIQFYQTD